MTESPPHPHGHRRGLLAILAGIVLGILVGMTYGRTMWLAVDGPQERIDRLQQTVEQKRAFARQAEAEGNADEARRLRGHVPVIQEEIGRLEAVRDDARASDLTTARHIAELIRFCGEIFLRLLMLIVVPLVVTSMISGITSLGDIRRMGKVGGWTMVYYMATGAAAVVLGITLVSIIQPGTGADDTFAYVSQNVLQKQESTLLGTLLEVVRGRADDPASGMVPENLFRAASETNVLALIVFSLTFGAALTMLGEKGRPAIDFFHAANEAVLRIVQWIIFLAPVGIFGLIATRVVQSGGAAAFADEVGRLGWFVATVMLGLAIHLGVLCAVLAVFGRRNPARFLYGTSRALLTALSTSSSSATLPITMRCVEEEGVSERSAGFVLPLGATINMDGTALYEATAAIFIAQSIGVPLGGAALVIVFFTATLAAVGAPGIPEAGLVTLLIVLSAVNLPAAGIGTILAIDWFLDRQRTAVNVFGDATGAAVIDRYLQRQNSTASLG